MQDFESEWPPVLNLCVDTYIPKTYFYIFRRKEGGRDLANIEDYVEATIQQLEEYTKKSKDRLLMAANNSRCNIWKTTKTRKKMGRKTII